MTKKIITVLLLLTVLFCTAGTAFAEDVQNVQLTQPVQTHEQHKRQKIIKITEDRLHGAAIPEGWHVVQMQWEKLSLVNYYHVVIEEN